MKRRKTLVLCLVVIIVLYVLIMCLEMVPEGYFAVMVDNDRNEIEILDNTEQGCPDENTVMVGVIKTGDEYETRVIKASNILDEVADLKNHFPDEEPCIVVGTMMC